MLTSYPFYLSAMEEQQRRMNELTQEQVIQLYKSPRFMIAIQEKEPKGPSPILLLIEEE